MIFHRKDFTYETTLSIQPYFYPGKIFANVTSPLASTQTQKSDQITVFSKIDQKLRFVVKKGTD